MVCTATPDSSAICDTLDFGVTRRLTYENWDAPPDLDNYPGGEARAGEDKSMPPIPGPVAGLSDRKAGALVQAIGSRATEYGGRACAGWQRAARRGTVGVHGSR